MSHSGGKDTKRHFTVVMGNKEHGLYVSSSPSSAARKAVTKLCSSNKNKKVEFHIREITQSSKKKTYGPYLGHIDKLKKPIELKGRLIKYKPEVKLLKKSGMTGGAIENHTNTSYSVFENFKVKNPENPEPYHLKQRNLSSDTFYFGIDDLINLNNNKYYPFSLININNDETNDNLFLRIIINTKINIKGYEEIKIFPIQNITDKYFIIIKLSELVKYNNELNKKYKNKNSNSKKISYDELVIDQFILYQQKKIINNLKNINLNLINYKEILKDKIIFFKETMIYYESTINSCFSNTIKRFANIQKELDQKALENYKKRQAGENNNYINNNNYENYENNLYDPRRIKNTYKSIQWKQKINDLKRERELYTKSQSLSNHSE